ncbi:hypothetical protein KP509_20G053900 [Ceratopteris richardii]|uniref:Uncharacterized protein n=1 Tax=Ceratopteris richardii TaxID=49495 RepID=A0A8T2SJC3_CERRI|nr:hypothetical protein KP509_20G053900 [Ceratopteris richardii]
MACERRGFYPYVVHEEAPMTAIVEEIVIRKPEEKILPSAPPFGSYPAPWTAQGHGQGPSGAQVIYVQNMFIQNIGNAGAVPCASMAAVEDTGTQRVTNQIAAKPFLANHPSFRSTTIARGVDFGLHVHRRLYTAEKQADQEHRIITYRQCLSDHRHVHLIMFLFDWEEAFDQAFKDWPQEIKLSDVERLVTDLHNGEFYMKKIDGDKIYVYLYLLKRHGRQLTERSHQVWLNLVCSCKDAMAQPDADNVSGGAICSLGPASVRLVE